MQDGSEWDVDIEIIAKDYATYHAKRDSEKYGEDYSTVYQEEFQFIMADNDEALDYARNNMEWHELDAKMSKPPAVDYAKTWNNADFEFVTTPEEAGKEASDV